VSTLITRAAAVALALSLAGCASTSISNRGERNEIDPFETYNRVIFGFNDAADRVVLKPIATIYDKYTPELVRFLLGNFSSNLGEINNGVNNLLQGKFKKAGSDGVRLFVNTTLGFAGFADVATELGLERNDEDFGQTLGFWGVPAGPYLVLPFIGPSSGRDVTNWVVGPLLNPMSRLDPKSHRVIYNSVQLIDLRASLLGASRLVDGAALDSYTFVRNGYFQRRLSLVYDGDPPFHKPPPDEDDKEPAAKQPEAKPSESKPSEPKKN
jgi:phospholipid-binding lipoprotein MlaA